MEAAIGSEQNAVQPMNNGEETAEQKSAMKIWIAVDESEGSFYALEWALQHLFLHDATDNKSVTVVHVQPPFQPTYTALSVGPVLFSTSGARESLEKAEEESAAKVLARTSELCDQHKLKAEFLVLKGKPKEILVEALEQMNIDLLVVGSQRAVLGSISDYCAHHANCPVLIVRPPKASEN